MEINNNTETDLNVSIKTKDKSSFCTISTEYRI